MGRGGAEPRRARPSEGAGQSSHWARSGWPLGAWGERGPRRGGAILFPALLPAPGEGTVWRRRRRRRGQRGRRRRLCPGMVVWGNAEGGGVTDGHGEGKTRAGVHEGDAVLHSAVTGREGNSFDQPSGREKKTLRGSSGDEHMQMTVQALQDELRIQRDLNQLFQQDSNSRTGEPCVAELTEENFQRLHTEHEQQAKELFLLRKTLEEMELRIETQKQTLNAQDESIKKLLEMLQSKGLSAKATEEDHERTRRLAEAEMHVHHLESLLEQKEKEDALLREEDMFSQKHAVT
ncbi:uncharacterized protein LOC130707373 isoform X2 [Balaenoptera acutorostrata]|uniref:Uncharacterized protein LOC130707373 isoform X2 n=1 Tax=Balaenoptera acutorostrata TaxID=9767 RepID=A0ABM3T670_BALAC|nr:uncharacterized protein LOC130707373 isoform X2 [Balaenoptera acutorostrata]